MKTVFSSLKEVCHAYANGNTIARCNNIFTNNNILYSYGYHYELAKFLDSNTILINNEGYSNTTAKHINAITQASRHLKQYFTKDVDINQVHGIVLSNYSCFLKARKPEKYISIIKSKFENLTNYPFKSPNLELEALFFEIELIYLKVCGDSEAVIAAETAQKQRLEAKKAAEAKVLAKKAKDFYNYKINSIRGNIDLVRLTKDGVKVETSQGVLVSLEAAKILYALIKAKKDIKGYNIEGSTVISINGVLKIGCHNICMKSVHRLGKLF